MNDAVIRYIVICCIMVLLSSVSIEGQTVGGGWNDLHVWYGEEAGHLAGHSVAVVGDLDNDSVIDFAVGAPGADPGSMTDAGAVYLYSGAIGNQIHCIQGTAEYELLGRSVVSPGDVDGDQVNDILVGAPGAKPGGMSYAGSAYLISGATGLEIMQFDVSVGCFRVP